MFVYPAGFGIQIEPLSLEEVLQPAESAPSQPLLTTHIELKMSLNRCLPLVKGNSQLDCIDKSHASLSSVPEEILRCTKTLEDLDLDANQLHVLPKGFFRLVRLRRLMLSDNELDAIPPDISQLVNLEELDVSKNEIGRIPDEIRHLSHLHTLDCSSNPIGELPDALTQLSRLTILALNDTGLTELPANIGALTNLRSLELRDNLIQQLPDSFARLQHLRVLDLGNNEMESFPVVLCELTTSLEELLMDMNLYQELPTEIGKLKALRSLDVSENRIEHIPEDLGQLLKLEDLQVSQNLLEYLPQSLCQCRFLSILKCDHNRLLALPPAIGDCVALEEIFAVENSLEHLPADIGRLRKLQTLNVDRNNLTDLPPELGNCHALTILHVRDNRLRTLPAELGVGLRQLRVLNLCGNQLEYLPHSLSMLPHLKALWLNDNQSKRVPLLVEDVEPNSGERILTCFLLPQQDTNTIGGGMGANSSGTIGLGSSNAGTTLTSGQYLQPSLEDLLTERQQQQQHALLRTGNSSSHNFGSLSKASSMESADLARKSSSGYVNTTTFRDDADNNNNAQPTGLPPPLSSGEAAVMLRNHHRLSNGNNQNQNNNMLSPDTTPAAVRRNSSSNQNSKERPSSKVMFADDVHTDDGETGSIAGGEVSAAAAAHHSVQPHATSNSIASAAATSSSNTGSLVNRFGQFVRHNTPHPKELKSRHAHLFKKKHSDELELKHHPPSDSETGGGGGSRKHSPLPQVDGKQKKLEHWGHDAYPHAHHRPAAAAVAGGGGANNRNSTASAAASNHMLPPKVNNADMQYVNTQINRSSPIEPTKKFALDAAAPDDGELADHEGEQHEPRSVMDGGDAFFVREALKNKSSSSSKRGSAGGGLPPLMPKATTNAPKEVDRRAASAGGAGGGRLTASTSADYLNDMALGTAAGHQNNSLPRDEFVHTNETEQQQNSHRSSSLSGRNGSSRRSMPNNASLSRTVDDSAVYSPRSQPRNNNDAVDASSSYAMRNESVTRAIDERTAHGGMNLKELSKMSASTSFPPSAAERELTDFSHHIQAASPRPPAGSQQNYDPNLPVVHVSIDRRRLTSGLGFSIAGGRGSTPYFKHDESVFISKITPNGPAAKAGLLIGDKVLAVNGVAFENISHYAAVDYIRTATPIIEMEVERNLTRTEEIESRIGGSAAQSAAAGVATSSTNDLTMPAAPPNVPQPSSTQVDYTKQQQQKVPVVRLNVVLYKEPAAGRGLGFSIAGGKGTAPVKGDGDESIFISRVADGGVAQRTGALFVGDRIIMINNVSVENQLHKDAVRLLTTGNTRRFELVIERDATHPSLTANSLPNNSFKSTAATAPGTPPTATSVGETTSHRRSEPPPLPSGKPYAAPPAEITRDAAQPPPVGPKPPPAVPVRVTTSTTTTNSSPSFTAAAAVPEPQRSPRIAAREQINIVTIKRDIRDDNDAVRKMPPPPVVEARKPILPPSSTAAAAVEPASSSPSIKSNIVEEVHIPRSRGRPLGISIVGGVDHSPVPFGESSSDNGIFISKIVAGGAAHATNRLRIGDRILSVQGVDLTQCVHAAAVEALSVPETHDLVMRVRHDPQPAGLREIVIRKAKQSEMLGMNVKGGADETDVPGNPHDENDAGIFISRILHGGAVRRDGRLRPGMRILEVSGESLLGASHKEAVNALRGVQDVLTIMVCDGFELADGEELPITPGLPKMTPAQPQPEPAKTSVATTNTNASSPRTSQRAPAAAVQPPSQSSSSAAADAKPPVNGKTTSSDPIAERYERERQRWQEEMARRRQELENEEERRKQRRHQEEQRLQQEILERVSLDRRRREQTLEAQRRSSKPFGGGGDRTRPPLPNPTPLFETRRRPAAAVELTSLINPYKQPHYHSASSLVGATTATSNDTASAATNGHHAVVQHKNGNSPRAKHTAAAASYAAIRGGSDRFNASHRYSLRQIDVLSNNNNNNYNDDEKHSGGLPPPNRLSVLAKQQPLRSDPQQQHGEEQSPSLLRRRQQTASLRRNESIETAVNNKHGGSPPTAERIPKSSLLAQASSEQTLSPPSSSMDGNRRRSQRGVSEQPQHQNSLNNSVRRVSEQHLAGFASNNNNATTSRPALPPKPRNLSVNVSSAQNMAADAVSNSVNNLLPTTPTTPGGSKPPIKPRQSVRGQPASSPMSPSSSASTTLPLSTAISTSVNEFTHSQQQIMPLRTQPAPVPSLTNTLTTTTSTSSNNHPTASAAPTVTTTPLSTASVAASVVMPNSSTSLTTSTNSFTSKLMPTTQPPLPPPPPPSSVPASSKVTVVVGDKSPSHMSFREKMSVFQYNQPASSSSAAPSTSNSSMPVETSNNATPPPPAGVVIRTVKAENRYKARLSSDLVSNNLANSNNQQVPRSQTSGDMRTTNNNNGFRNETDDSASNNNQYAVPTDNLFTMSDAEKRAQWRKARLKSLERDTFAAQMVFQMTQMDNNTAAQAAEEANNHHSAMTPTPATSLEDILGANDDEMNANGRREHRNFSHSNVDHNGISLKNGNSDNVPDVSQV